MYRLTCDGFPLLDWRDNDLTLVNPKLNLEVNTVGEGSFTIYKSHPYYDKIQKLKSVFEVSDDTGVIFRGRATGDSRDFDHGMAVDLEGAMAFFNDSVVRPFSFPKDFLEDDGYLAAEQSGNVVEYFLSWLIDKHNAQVQDFQKMKLGNVTVTDPDNAIIRSSSNYVSTWDALKSKLIDSALGGYLCIRYEEDGNYIDYLSEFTETNSQRIEYGENLLDLKNETEALTTYSAVIPIGAAEITIEGQPDKDLTDDLVKSGDTIYSRKAVAAYGWICAPTSETTWDDVVDDADLVKTAAEWLANEGIFQLSSIEAAAVDLHFTDEQAESLRIYKNVEVHSKPHGVTETFPLDRLEIDLLNPQNTRITVGKTLASLTERTSIQQDEAIQRYSKISKSAEEIKMEVHDELEKLATEMQVALGSLSFSVSNGETSSTLKLMAGETELDSAEIKLTGVVTFAGLKDGSTTIDGACIKTGTIDADRLNLAGQITFGDLDEELQSDIENAGGISEEQAKTLITSTLVSSPTIKGGTFKNLTEDTWFGLGEDDGKWGFVLSNTANSLPIFGVYNGDPGYTSFSGKLGFTFLTTEGSMKIVMPKGKWDFSCADSVNFGGASAEDLGISVEVLTDGTAELYIDRINNGRAFFANRSIAPIADDCWIGLAGYYWKGGLFEELYVDGEGVTSDRNKKHDIFYDLSGYDALFDALRPVGYKLNNGTSGRVHIGMIAQEVEEAVTLCGMTGKDFGAVVNRTEEDGTGQYYLRYTEFIGLLVDQVQKLKARVAEMEMKLA